MLTNEKIRNLQFCENTYISWMSSWENQKQMDEVNQSKSEIRKRARMRSQCTYPKMILLYKKMDEIGWDWNRIWLALLAQLVPNHRFNAIKYDRSCTFYNLHSILEMWRWAGTKCSQMHKSFHQIQLKYIFYLFSIFFAKFSKIFLFCKLCAHWLFFTVDGWMNLFPASGQAENILLRPSFESLHIFWKTGK